ncbi:MAG: NAD(P)-dependent alcohol dehydrogenase [Methanobacteriota archaeon]|nr:MAG: NAD(P)-dependent alcohol dehydrogenase [Euryarchaeota archaeon]
MTQKTPAYGARGAKAPVAPMTIERRDPGPHDVEIEILYCGICHSDVHKVNDDWGNTQFPIVPGHEIVGRVVSQGTRASRHREGDLVGVGCFVDSCRACEQCRAGHEMFCTKGATFTFDSLEQDQKARTYGGYSANMVVDERYVLRVPKGLEASRAAPLMCAGITTYSPLRRFGCKPGDQVAVMGLGGVGHMAVKLARSMGADVTVLSTSPGKAEAAARLGAKAFVATSQPGALDPLGGTFDLIVDTVSAPHDLDKPLALLRNFGTMVLLGLPPDATSATPIKASSLVFGNKRLAGSNIGGIPETQEMLDHCGKNGIVADVEIIRAEQINEAYKRMQRGDVRYRFVIDCASIGA